MVGAPPSAIAPAELPAVPALRAFLQVCRQPGLTLISGVLVTLPVFLQAPWVRLAPFSAALFTAPLLGLALALSKHPNSRTSRLGELLVGFCGSWLAGSLFWGWCRLHPVWHLPIEAFALPLALAGLNSRWKIACAFYLGSLLGTAATDVAIAGSGLMPSWPQILNAGSAEAPFLLQTAAQQVLAPPSLVLVFFCAAVLVQGCRWLWGLGEVGRIISASLATTLAVDALFLLAALEAPNLSGLI